MGLAGGLRERYELPYRGLGQSPSRNRIRCLFSLKIWHQVATISIIFVRINWPNFARLNSKDKSGQSQKYLGRQCLPLPLIKSAYGHRPPELPIYVYWRGNPGICNTDSDAGSGWLQNLTGTPLSKGTYRPNVKMSRKDHALSFSGCWHVTTQLTGGSLLHSVNNNSADVINNSLTRRPVLARSWVRCVACSLAITVIIAHYAIVNLLLRHIRSYAPTFGN